MTDRLSDPVTAFRGLDLLCTGTRLDVALAVKRAEADSENARPILVFDDSDGRVVDFDLRGSDAEIAERLAAPTASPRGRFRSPPETNDEISSAPRSRGRPKLGVVSREVTLLPRHWDWLAGQRGGASATLRRLVDEARKGQGDEARKKMAQEAAYNFLQAIAGDLAGYEDATRVLFKGDRAKFECAIADWPASIRNHALRLAFGPDAGPPNEGNTET